MNYGTNNKKLSEEEQTLVEGIEFALDNGLEISYENYQKYEEIVKRC